MDDLYALLGVSRDASADEIKAAWRSRTDAADPGGEEFRRLNFAVGILLDADKRAEYDSTLPAGPAAEATQTVEDAPTPAPEPATPTRSRLLPIMALVLAAGVVAAVVLSVVLTGRVSEARDGRQAAASAERALAAVLSYDYRRMEADRKRAVAFLTDRYAEDFNKTFDLLVDGPEGEEGGAVKTKAVVTATVLNVGVVPGGGDDVRVLAYVDQSSTKAGASPTTFQNRVVATMTKDGDDWLIDELRSY